MARSRQDGTEQEKRAIFGREGGATWASERGREPAARTEDATRHAGQSAESGPARNGGLTWRGASLLARRSRPVSRARGDGTTANRHISEGREPGQDGPSARTELLKRELPRERDQGLETCLRQRIDRPLEQPAGGAGCSRVGWTSATPRDTWLADGQTTWPTTAAPPNVRRWVGRTVCLSCDSCLL
jgi:hypothetical protein